MTPPHDVLDKVLAMPDGSIWGCAFGQRYRATKSSYCAGRALKLVADRSGGGDYISLKMYLLTRGARLFPCEMPLAKVVAFVRLSSQFKRRLTDIH